MSNLTWVVAGIIIIAATILIVWLRHNFKIQKIKFKTGMIETELERNAKDTEKAVVDTSVNISGNKMFGRNKIAVRREKTSISDNTLAGENVIEVGAKPGPKTKGKKSGKKK
jgi:hypothetical protein